MNILNPIVIPNHITNSIIPIPSKSSAQAEFQNPSSQSRNQPKGSQRIIFPIKTSLHNSLPESKRHQKAHKFRDERKGRNRHWLGFCDQRSSSNYPEAEPRTFPLSRKVWSQGKNAALHTDEPFLRLVTA